jgi:tRNA dimethylallyltransferase
VPVVAGGTGLYLRAAVADLAFPVPADAAVRARAESLAAGDLPAAVAALRARDPAAAARVDVRNPRRVARALEVAESGGGAGPGGRLWSGETRRPTLLVGVTRPLAALDGLIAARVRRELDDGLVAEIEAALDGAALCREAAQIIGVREVLALRAGRLAPGDLPAVLAARTRRLARRQLTWLRKTPGVVPLDLGEGPAAAALPRLLERWRRASGD